MLTPSSVVQLLLAITATWSSFFWEPVAQHAFLFGWFATLLLLLIPAPQGKPIKQATCYFPSLAPVLAFFLFEPIFSGWSITYTFSLMASLALFLLGHIAYHWERFKFYSPKSEALSRNQRWALSFTHLLRVMAVSAWTLTYISAFYMEWSNGFSNSDTPMVWLINLIFLSIVLCFCVFLLTPVQTAPRLLWFFEFATATVSFIFLMSTSLFAAGLAGSTDLNTPGMQSLAFAYFSLAPSFLTISMLALAIHRVSSQLSVTKHKIFRALNEPH